MTFILIIKQYLPELFLHYWNAPMFYVGLGFVIGSVIFISLKWFNLLHYGTFLPSNQFCIFCFLFNGMFIVWVSIAIRSYNCLFSDASLDLSRTCHRRSSSSSITDNIKSRFLASSWPIVFCWCMTSFFIFSQFSHLSSTFTLLVSFGTATGGSITKMKLIIVLTLKENYQTKSSK